MYILKNLLFITFFLVAASNISAQKTRKAIFIIVDGISADVIEKVETPALDAIAKEGGYARAYVGGEKNGYSQTPTISAVGYNSLLTGTWVNKHNVWDNDIEAPNYNYHTIFRFLENARPDSKTAVFSTWLDNRTKLVGESLKETGNLQLDDHFDGLELDTISYPHDRDSRYINLIDEAVTDTAAARIRRNGYDLTWVYLQYTDDMGHRYGDNERFYDAIRIMDTQVKRIWDAVQYRRKQFNEEWVIYITTDHGRDPVKGSGHGGQSERERSTWIVTSEKNVNSYFKSGKPAVVDIMLSIASYLGLEIPREQKMEIDGVSLTDSISVIEPFAKLDKNKIIVTWKAIDNKGKAKIWLSSTNNFKSGGKDEYKLMKEVNVADEKVVIDIRNQPSGFYKIVIEAPHNFLNRWIIRDSVISAKF